MANKVLKNLQKLVDESLGFLEVGWVRTLLIVLLIVYVAGGIPMLTAEVANIFHHPAVKVAFIVLILYVGLKDIPLALLLALAFVLSLQMGYRYQLGAHAGLSSEGAEAGVEAGLGNDHEANVSLEAKLGNIEGMTDDQEDDVAGFNYNNYTDCVKDCADGDLDSGSLDSPCKGVGVWDKELNAQGLNCPLGYSGEKEGSPF